MTNIKRFRVKKLFPINSILATCQTKQPYPDKEKTTYQSLYSCYDGANCVYHCCSPLEVVHSWLWIWAEIPLLSRQGDMSPLRGLQNRSGTSMKQWPTLKVMLTVSKNWISNYVHLQMHWLLKKKQFHQWNQIRTKQAHTVWEAVAPEVNRRKSGFNAKLQQSACPWTK